MRSRRLGGRTCRTRPLFVSARNSAATQARSSTAYVVSSARGRVYPSWRSGVRPFGTGINTHASFVSGVAERISDLTGLRFQEASNHFEAQSARDAAVEASGMLKVVACSLMKIANDIRWLASGPRTGLAEIQLPELQPGSSIMPGKVNPVMSEMLTMVAAQVMGNDLAITIGGERGHFELNVMIPVIAHNLLESIEILASGSRVFADSCVAGITADEERCAGTRKAPLPSPRSWRHASVTTRLRKCQAVVEGGQDAARSSS